jgi:uncharacterized protein (TIGR02996 family)
MSGELAKGFLDDIVTNIDDDTPRLVYADWLTENGQDERAEFIRVQVERASLPAWDPAQVCLRLREEELLLWHGSDWLAELPAIEGAKWEGFRRGIVAEVSFASFEQMRDNAQACRAVAPVEAVTVRWPRRRKAKKAVRMIAELRELSLTGMLGGEDEITRLAESPQLSTLRCLTARGVWAATLGILAASPHLAGLRTLRLPSNNLGNAGIRALTEAASLTALEELDLTALGEHERYNNDPVIRSAGMGALVGWSGLAGIRSLNLTRNDVTRDGLRALLRSPNAAALKELTLRGTRLDGQMMEEFCSALPGLRLETLDLGENILGEVGLSYLVSARCLRELKVLRLDRCEIPLAGARLLAKKAPFLDSLRLLDVGYNNFGPPGLAALMEREPPLLHSLRIPDNDLFDNGTALLAGSPASNSLLELDLSRNGLGPPSALALSESEHLGKLLVLRLADNPIIAPAASALMASPLGQRLTVLEMDQSQHQAVRGMDPPPTASGPDPLGGDEIPF